MLKKFPFQGPQLAFELFLSDGTTHTTVNGEYLNNLKYVDNIVLFFKFNDGGKK